MQYKSVKTAVIGCGMISDIYMQNLKEIDIKLYSTDDVCKLLHIGKQKCLQLFHQEDFPSIKIGRKFWIKADCLNEFLSHKRIMVE